MARLTTRKVAERAGVPLGTLHYWFGSKEDLVEAVARRHIERMGHATSPAAGLPGDPTTEAGPGEAARVLFRAALEVESEQEVGARLAPRELISWALRSGRADLAAELGRTQRDAARVACADWYDRFGADLGLGLAALADLVAVFYDGLAQAWIADPDGIDPEAVTDVLCQLLEARARER